MSCRCQHCRRRFASRAQNPDQEYCNRKVCQNERRRIWRRKRLRSDADYRANQRASHNLWLSKHPDYYRQWRRRNPDYVERNRHQQRTRDRLKRDLAVLSKTGAVLAKSDACQKETSAITDYYELVPVQPAILAKSDASKRIFQLIPTRYEDIVGTPKSCKEITRGTLADGSATASICPGPSP